MISYLLYNPTGNMTALVTDAVAAGNRPNVAKEILEKEPSAEQVGFLSDSMDTDIRLDMACGEFCGNASMSAALHKYLSDGSTGEREIIVSVSGAAAPVPVTIHQNGEAYDGQIKMPGPFSIKSLVFNINGKDAVFPAVDMPGITHIILQSARDEWLLSPELAESLLQAMCRQAGVECLGIMFYNPKSAEMRPLVYVDDIESLYWESSCASGTSALGYYLAATGALAPWDVLSISQPGGILRVASPKPGEILLTGNIKYVKEGKI